MTDSSWPLAAEPSESGAPWMPAIGRQIAVGRVPDLKVFHIRDFQDPHQSPVGYPPSRLTNPKNRPRILQFILEVVL